MIVKNWTGRGCGRGRLLLSALLVLLAIACTFVFWAELAQLLSRRVLPFYLPVVLAAGAYLFWVRRHRLPLCWARGSPAALLLGLAAIAITVVWPQQPVCLPTAAALFLLLLACLLGVLGPRVLLAFRAPLALLTLFLLLPLALPVGPIDLRLTQGQQAAAGDAPTVVPATATPVLASTNPLANSWRGMALTLALGACVCCFGRPARQRPRWTVSVPCALAVALCFLICRLAAAWPQAPYLLQPGALLAGWLVVTVTLVGIVAAILQPQAAPAAAAPAPVQQS